MKKTAQDIAIDLIKRDVLNGDDINHIRQSMIGSGCSDYSVKIGVYINGKLRTDKIEVYKMDGKELKEPIIFAVKDLMDIILAKQKTLL